MDFGATKMEIIGTPGHPAIRSVGLIYGKKYLIDEWIRVWDALAIKQHLDHLVKKGMIKCTDGLYARTYSGG